MLAHRLYCSVVIAQCSPHRVEIADAFAATAVGHGLTQLRLGHDTEFCVQIDCMECVPQLEQVDSAPGGMRMMWRGEAEA